MTFIYSEALDVKTTINIKQKKKKEKNTQKKCHYSQLWYHVNLSIFASFLYYNFVIQNLFLEFFLWCIMLSFENSVFATISRENIEFAEIKVTNIRENKIIANNSELTLYLKNT